MDQDALPSAKCVVAYSGAPSGLRYEAWREELCREFCRLDVEPNVGERIDCKVEFAQLGSLTLATPLGSSAQFARTRELLSDARDDLVLLIAVAGRTLLRHSGRPFVLMPSEMYLTEMSAECSADLADGNRFAAIRIPRSELLSICPKAEDRISKVMIENAPLRETIAHYYDFARDAASRLDPDAQRLVARHMVDLVALLLGTGPEEAELARSRGHWAARLRLIEDDIADRLGESDLTIDAIAERHGLSPKQIQRAFERGGTTLSEFVLEQRLIRARRLLGSAGNRGKKIAELAFDAGFGDLSYFNRVFRKRFCVTPSEWCTAPADSLVH